jgi:probable addiction module antidote protein
MSTPPFITHEETARKSFRNDPAFAAEYVNAVIEDGDEAELLLALRRMTEAFSGVPQVAKEANLNATTLYHRTPSVKGNPELKSLNALLRALGLRIAVQPLGHR